MTGESLPYELRKTWCNHLGNQSIDPLRIYAPRTIEQVVRQRLAGHGDRSASRCSTPRSASAAIVLDGLTPIAVGTIEPSRT